MDPKIRNEQIWLITGSLAILAVIALSVALSLTRQFMVPFVLAVFIAGLVAPVVDYQVVRLRFPQWAAVLVAFVIVLGIMTILGMFVIGAVQSVVDKAIEYSQSMKQVVERTFDWIEQFGWSEETGSLYDRDKITREITVQIPQVAAQTAGTALQLVSNTTLVIIFAIFLLAGRNPYAASTPVYAAIDSSIRQYIATKVLLSSITGVLVWATLRMLGLDMASTFGVLACLLNFIPSLGSIVATLLPIPVAIVDFDSGWKILAVIVVPGTIQMTIGNVIEPKMMGQGLELHPVTILLALAFWGLLWGVVGMILAVPIMASIRIVLMQFTITQPIGNVLAGVLPGSQPAESVA